MAVIIILAIALIIVLCIVYSKKSKEKSEQRIEELKRNDSSVQLWKAVYCPLFQAWQKICAADDGSGYFVIDFVPETSGNRTLYNAQLDEGTIYSDDFMYRWKSRKEDLDSDVDHKLMLSALYGLTSEESDSWISDIVEYSELDDGGTGLSSEHLLSIPARDIYFYTCAFGRTLHEKCPHLDVGLVRAQDRSALVVTIKGSDHAGTYKEG